MEKIISCCGLNCAGCDARIATMNNDDNLRKETAEKWRVMYNAPGITPEMINCTGCRQPGVKISHWNECAIRKCAGEKNFRTCGACNVLESCETIRPVLSFAPDAADNLRSEV